MKFTREQLQFIKSKFPEMDEIVFAKEALEFSPIKKQVKEIPDNERCCANKVDGNRCSKRVMKDSTKCSIHHGKAEKVAQSVVVVKEVAVKCCSLTKKNEPCKKNAIASGRCMMHQEVSKDTPQPILVA